jgi:xylan 1,4-beta-xylosidase
MIISHFTICTLETKEKELDFEINLPKIDGQRASLLIKRVDEECCNPLKIWHDMGEPAYPCEEQTELIKSAAQPLTQSSIIKDTDGSAVIDIRLGKNAVVYFTLSERKHTPDRGYDYDKVLNFH